jgi:hypothetical protein
MALPTLDAVFASAADQPRRMMLAQWLVNVQYSGSVADYYTLPEQYLWAKIAVAEGAPKSEADYISLPKQYVWKAIYDVVSGSSAGTTDWSEKQALGHIAAAYRGDTANPANLATYIDWPWRYQVASIITNTAIDTNAQAFITTSGATDVKGIDQFVKEVKLLGLWDSMVSWPLRSSQNAGIGTTAYSLGGLGTFNGTLVNGPVWTAGGLVTDATNEHVALPDATSLRNTRSAMFAFKPDDNSYNQELIEIQGLNTSRYASFAFDGQDFFGVTRGHKLNTWRNGALSQNQNGSRLLSLGTFRTGAYTADNTSDNVFDNGTLAAGGTRTGLSALNPSGDLAYRHVFGLSLAMTGAFAMTSTATWTNSQVAALHTLYKQTLGMGLGLP